MLPVLARQHFVGGYRAARLGLLWTAIQPLIRGAVLAFVFTQIVRIETDSPYPAFVLAGTATWAWISQSVTGGTTSIVATAGLAGRVYFPRLILPAMPAAASLPSFGITLVVVIGVAAGFGAPPTVRLLALPVALIAALLLVFSMAMCLSLLHVYFRDIGHLVQSGMLMVFYATPIIYPASMAGRFEPLLHANPFSGVVLLIRWSLLGSSEPLLVPVAWMAGWTLVLGAIGMTAFRRFDRICVDRL
ncbi:MAG: ABC transporter permease [Nitriliruptorales bacterium]|nr:ABC transporter permease [Nitriliruptorales bacterium]